MHVCPCVIALPDVWCYQNITRTRWSEKVTKEQVLETIMEQNSSQNKAKEMTVLAWAHFKT